VPPSPRPTSPRPSSRILWWRLTWHRATGGWALFAWTFALLTATHWPGEFHCEVEVASVAFDHWVHLALYGPLTLLLIGFLGQLPVHSFWRRGRYWLAPALLLAVGALDELTQPLMTTWDPALSAWRSCRDCSFRDWLSDATGIMLATVVALLVGRILSRPASAEGH
jgi:hypothetical protein